MSQEETHDTAKPGLRVALEGCVSKTPKFQIQEQYS
jgi:hypothetical protein